MRNMRDGGMSASCRRWSLTGMRFFSSTAKTGVALEIISGSLTPTLPPPNTTEVRRIWGRCRFSGGGGRKTPRFARGVWFVIYLNEPLHVHLINTNAPSRNKCGCHDWYYQCCVRFG